jgi:HEAT repeat protein
MSACPTCGKPVDPLRARAVSVVDGKVVGYCSADCAAQAGAKASLSGAARAVAATESAPITAVHSGKVPAPHTQLDSEPVIEILHEPSSGVVTSARDERKPTPLPVSPDDYDDDDDDDDDDGESDDADDDDDDSGEYGDATTPDRPAVKQKADESAGVKPSEVLAAAQPDAGSSTMLRKRRRNRDSMNAKAAWEWLDEEPAEPVDPRGSKYGRRTGRNVLIALLVLALAGGGGYVYYEYVYLKKRQVDAAAQTSKVVDAPVVPAAAPVAVDAPPKLTTEDALESARGVLRGYLTSRSVRIQRRAAQALARTGDKAAIDVLVAALGDDKTDARLEVAHALARAGDKRGFEALVAALGSPRRDAKLEAGRWLSLLGDKRAANTLESYLEVQQLRLGVAEQLAYIADAKALDVLQQIRRDDKASPDEKARATIALGNAGKAEVADELRQMLEDRRNNAFAATALAGLHDEAARPVLIKQLDVPSLRVAAARGLRRLSPELDPASWLPKLVDNLAAAKDTEQIDVAEAILLLAGPAVWSERG